MQPLDDLTIVDLTQSIAGPVCTQLLGEMGANVIKVEPPSGDNFRNLMGGSMFTPFNHGKESVCVDMKTDEGHAIVTELVGEADIVVESFRPGSSKSTISTTSRCASETKTSSTVRSRGSAEPGPIARIPDTTRASRRSRA